MGTISQGDLSSITELVKKNKIEDASEFELASRGLHYASSNYSRVYNIYNKKVQAINLDYSNGKLSQTSYQSELSKLRNDMEPIMAQWQRYNDLLSQMINKFQSEIAIPTPKTAKEEISEEKVVPDQRKRKGTYTENSESNSESPKSELSMKRSKMICLTELSPSSRPSDKDVICVTSSSKKSSNEAEDVIEVTPNLAKKNRTSVAVSTDPRMFFVPPDSMPVSFYANFHVQKQVKIPLEVLNEIGVQIIVGLCEEGYSVSWENVLQRLFLRYRVHDLAHFGLKRATDIPCIQHLMKINEKIHLYMQAYSFLQPVGTLFDLDHSLAQLFNKNSFDDLCVGPLVKHPHVYEVFKFPTNLSLAVPQITISDVLFHLHKYLSDNKLWNTSVSLSDFLEFLKNEFKVNSPYELGIRIKGLGLAISSIKSVQRTRKQAMDQARDKLRNEIKRMCEAEVSHIKKELEEKFCRDERNVDPVSVAIKTQKRRYATLDATAVLVDVIETCRILFESKPFFKKLREFLYQIQNDQLLRKLFQVALCIGRMALPDDAIPPHLKKSFMANQRRSLNIDPSSSSTSSSSETEDESEENKAIIATTKPVAEKPFESQIIEFLNESYPLPISISTLARIENRTIARFNFPSFHEMSGHSFLDFLCAHAELMEESLPESLVTAVSQIPEILTMSEENLKKLLNHHVKSVRSMKSLITKARSTRPSRTVIHELSLIDITSMPPKVSKRDGDLRQMALNVLYQCPLLDDLNEFSHWKIIFEPYLGDISNFLIKNSNASVENFAFDVVALDTGKQLLRLTNKATLDLIEKALSDGDAKKYIGLLISFIAVQHCSLTHSPIALLTNMLHKSLLSLSCPAAFVLECICYLPMLLLPSLVMRLFIEPLSRVEGSVVAARSKLKDLCWEPSQKLRLEYIGLLLGITEWASDFDLRCDKVNNDPLLVRTSHRTANADFISGEMLSTDKYVFERREVKSLKTFVANSDVSCISKIQPIETETIKADTISLEADHFINERSALENSDVANVDQYTHVGKIRRDKFGVGVTLSEEGELLAQSLRKLVGRSLDRLSKELYSCDMHFVLELVQNADDNRYSKNQAPSVRFEISNDLIRVLNNEDGFTRADVEALCDVGKSTKGRHSQGYIGQKGIGFKSVFAITDRPEIHSGGYHINFDVNKGGPVGYILPEWMDSAPNIDPQWTTIILLPLKSETERQRHKARSLAASFRDLHPALLLFLNRLNKLEICNYVSGELCTFVREKSEHGIVRLKATVNDIVSVKEWIVVKRKLHVPEQMKPCLHVDFTEIAIAVPKIPLYELRSVSPPPQDVFAFLPLRSFGLPFIVQADFDVPASRQDITSDSEWNQWLLLQFPALFVEELYPLLRQIHHNNDVDAAEAFIRFLPSLSQSVGCFYAVAREILRLVRELPLFPCVNSSDETIWCTAAQTAIVHDAFLRTVLTPELLSSHLNLNYLHQQVASLPQSLIQALGIHELEFRDVLEVLQSACPKKLEDIAGWLLCLARAMLAIGAAQEEELLNRLKTLPIIPLSSGTLVSINECSPIFLPVACEAGDFSQQVVHDDLNMIDHRIFDTFSDELCSSQVRSLLLQAGVKHVTPIEVVEQHVLRILSSDSWREKSDDVLVGYVVYIWNIWRRDPSAIDIEMLKPHLQIKTCQGFQNPSRAVLNFPLSYGNRYNLMKDFSACSWLLIDEVYLDSARPRAQRLSIADKMKWHSFFERIGVKDFLTVQQRKVELSRGEFEKSQWSAWFDLVPSEFSAFVVEDWYCDQFERLATANEDSTVALFKAIEENWNSYYDKFKVAQLLTQDGQKIREVDSTFFYQLKNLRWIPTTCVKYTEQQKEVKEVKSYPSNTFIPCPLFNKLFSHNVFYLKPERDIQSLFAQDIGLVQNVKPADVLDKLISWSSEKPFYASLDHMSDVYEFLWRSIDETTLRKAFDDHSIIFIPEQACIGYAVYKGRFVDRRDACWSDPSGLFVKYNPTFMLHGTTKFHRVLLLQHYKPDFYDFFHRVVRVSDSPTIDEYAALLIYASQSLGPDAISDVFEIYSTIGKRCAAAITPPNNSIPGAIKEHILDLIREKKIFPTIDDQWVSIENVPIIPDNVMLVEKFGNKVNFLKIPNTRSHTGLITDLPAHCVLFFDICNIHRLTDVLETEIVTELLRPAPAIQNFASRIVPYVQLYMIRHFPDEYNILKSQDFAKQLNEIRFFSVGRLEVVYRLKHDHTIIVALPSKCCFQADKYIEFYIHRDSVKKPRDICQGLAEMFSGKRFELTRNLANFMNLLKDELDNIDNFSKYQDFSLVLPGNETKWEVPLVDEPMDAECEEDFVNSEKVQALLQFTEESLNKSNQSLNKSNLSFCWPPMESRQPPTPKQNQEVKSVPDIYSKYPRPEAPETWHSVTQGNRPQLNPMHNLAHKNFNPNSSPLPFPRGAPSSTPFVRGPHLGNNGRSPASVLGDNVSHNSAEQFHSCENISAYSSSSQDASLVERENADDQTKHASSDFGFMHFDSSEFIYQTEPIDELEFEPVKLDEMNKDLMLSLENCSINKEQIGLWGETWVHEHLKAQYSEEIENGKVSVKWLNENGETGSPYDFVINFSIEDKQIYIEVKTTVGETRQYFPISLQELRLALDNPETYHVYRVYNGGNFEKAKLRIIKDLIFKMDSKSVRLFMVV